MSHTKASPFPHGVPPPRDAVVRRSVDGVYRESMPAEPGRDAEMLQRLLLTSHEPRRASITATATAFMSDWFVRLVEWFGRICSTCMAMIGIKR